MINAKDIRQTLTLKNINDLMDYLKTEPKVKNNLIMSRTICHSGGSHKLYYYNNNKVFHCYTNCGTFDVFELIQKVKDVDFKNAFKWIKAFFGFTNNNVNISHYKSDVIDPVAKVKKELKQPKLKKLDAVDPKILNSYDDIAYLGWIKQGITTRTLKKYHIKLDIPGQQIIIPEYDHNNRLIGVRSRHLDKFSLDNGSKYTPVNYKGTELKYPTGQVLYGLNFNKEAITKYHKLILFEAEKSVMKLDSAVGSKNISVALNGSSLTQPQIDLIRRLNVTEIMVALDKEFIHPYTRMEHIYAEEIYSEFKRLSQFCHVSIVWDVNDVLNYKDSPIDKGFKKFKQLLHERMFVYGN